MNAPRIDPNDIAGAPHSQILAAAEATRAMLAAARSARRTIGRLSIPAETELRDAIGDDLDTVLRQLEKMEQAAGLALRIMADTPYLSLVEAELRRLEMRRLIERSEIGGALGAAPGDTAGIVP